MIDLKINTRLLLLLALSLCFEFFSYAFKDQHAETLFSSNSPQIVFRQRQGHTSYTMEKKYAAFIERAFQDTPAAQDGLGCTIAGPKAIKLFYNQPRNTNAPTRAERHALDITAEIMQCAAPR